MIHILKLAEETR